MLRFTLALGIAFLAASSASAHFPWLAIDEEGKVVYFFGETLAERNYQLPEPIAKAPVMWLNKKGIARKIALRKVESDEFIGMKSEQPLKRAQLLIAKVTYGMYAGSRLDYYSTHQIGRLPKNRDAYAVNAEAKNADEEKNTDKRKNTDKKKNKTPQLDLQAQLVDTDKGVDVFVLWKGKPLSGVTVSLYCEEGHEEGAAKTDKHGKVSFSDKEVEDGLNGIMVGHKLEKDAGEFGGTKCTSSSHYLTVTFRDPQDFE